MRRVIGMGVLAAALTAAATLVWVDVLDDQRAGAVAPVRYAPPAVEVDEGVHLTRAEVAAEIDRLVNDPRGWHTNMDRFTVRVVSPGVGGTQPMPGHIGIAYADDLLVLVTDEAWTVLGPKFAAVGGTVEDQRTWIVLHELGHLLGHGHTECVQPGPAPVMRAVNYDLRSCTFNVWPQPVAS